MTPSGDDARARSGPPSTPRWVKISAIVAVILLLLIGALALFGDSSHGPGRHTSSETGGGDLPPSVLAGYTPRALAT